MDLPLFCTRSTPPHVESAVPPGALATDAHAAVGALQAAVEQQRKSLAAEDAHALAQLAATLKQKEATTGAAGTWAAGDGQRERRAIAASSCITVSHGID